MFKKNKAPQAKATKAKQEDAKQEAKRIASRYDSPDVKKFVGNSAALVNDLQRRRKEFEETVQSAARDKNLVMAAELARNLFPDAFEIADDACSAIATTLTRGLGELFKLAPPPLDAALKPLGGLCGKIVFFYLRKPNI